MSLSKKKSRPIQIGDQKFRWVFFENSGWNDLTIQSAAGSGPKLIVQLPWGDEQNPNDPPVTPLMVSTIIEAALKRGWEPQGRSKTLRLRWSENALHSV